jgi:hypothetical protein
MASTARATAGTPFRLEILMGRRESGDPVCLWSVRLKLLSSKSALSLSLLAHSPRRR